MQRIDPILVENAGIMTLSWGRTDDGWEKTWIFNKIAWSAATGAKNIAWAAVEGSHSGAYVSTCQEMPPASCTLTPEGLALEAKVWSEMVEVWVKEAPEVLAIIGS
ncbi:hypothetical protein RQP46_007813 [Phenoliferia psychrophenolica]